MKGRLTITEVAKQLGVTPRTIMRWEKGGKIRKSKRDWRGWRFYHSDDLDEIKKFYESTYEYEALERPVLNGVKALLAAFLLTGILSSALFFASSDTALGDVAGKKGVIETQKTVDIVLDELPVISTPEGAVAEPVNYTLGPNDVIAIEVRRHPEFGGEYIINSEGKIQYKFVGDIIITGMTKKKLKEELTKILSDYLIEPEIDVQIVQYLSKVFYVVGDVNMPGKFFMRGDTLTVREALIQAGLPTEAASMRRCRIITPNQRGKNNFIYVNAYKLLYEGDLKENKVMRPGDVLYVPATIMAKIIRVISPVTNVMSQATGVTARGAAIGAGGI